MAKYLRILERLYDDVAINDVVLYAQVVLSSVSASYPRLRTAFIKAQRFVRNLQN